MYALVAPLVRLPRSLMPGAFDYHVPEALAGSVAAGSLVRVPWRSKPTTGVVLEVRATPDIPPAKAKDILGLAHPAPLPADCLAALRMVADEGVVPLANAADALVPEAPKRESKTAPDDASAAREDRPAANVAVSQARYANFAEKASRLVDALGPHLAAGQGCLVLAPHLDDLAPLAAELGQAFADVPLARLDSTLAKVPLWRGWTSGLAPGARIVLGTRGACLAPLANPGVIVVLEAPSRDHRSFDQQPKFDAREVARVRAEVARVPLVVMGAAGRAEDDAHDDVATEHSPTIVDTSGTRGQEGTLFPEPLRDAVEEAVAAGKRAAIVHNRRGSFRVLACVACSAPARSGATAAAGSQRRCRRAPPAATTSSSRAAGARTSSPPPCAWPFRRRSWPWSTPTARPFPRSGTWPWARLRSRTRCRSSRTPRRSASSR
jgi:primosomal protein N' (replication factor Y)